MNMHGTARLFLHWFCHKGGVKVMIDRRLPHRALKQKSLICEIKRMSMVEINFHLRGASFMA